MYAIFPIIVAEIVTFCDHVSQEVSHFIDGIGKNKYIAKSNIFIGNRWIKALWMELLMAQEQG